MSSFPSSLAVYLSNRCNLACPYCYVAVNQGAPATLGFDRLKNAISYFLSRAPRSGRKITFLGGEPLLDFPLVRRAVDYLRAEDRGELAVHLFTNGRLLDEKRLRFLQSRQVDVVLSLSVTGRKEILSRLAGCPAAGLGASLVFSPRSTPGLLRDVDFLYRAGFKKIFFSPDVTAFWSAADAARLTAALAGFARYYEALLRGGAAPFEIGNIYEALARASGSRPEGKCLCPHLVLAADGRYYPCDKLLHLPLADIRPWSVGSTDEGLNLGRRQAYFEEALNSAKSAGFSRRQASHCPVGVFSLCKSRPALSPGDIRARMTGSSRVAKIFSRALLILARRLKDEPAFRRAHHVAG
jgi:hypothetical protein